MKIEIEYELEETGISKCLKETYADPECVRKEIDELLRKVREALGKYPEKVKIRVRNIHDILKPYVLAKKIGKPMIQKLTLTGLIIYAPENDEEGMRFLETIYNDRCEEDPEYRSTPYILVDYATEYVKTLTEFEELFKKLSSMREVVYEPIYLDEETQIRVKTPPKTYVTLEVELAVEFRRAELIGLGKLRENNPETILKLLRTYGVERIDGLIITQILPTDLLQRRISFLGK